MISVPTPQYVVPIWWIRPSAELASAWLISEMPLCSFLLRRTSPEHTRLLLHPTSQLSWKRQSIGCSLRCPN